MYMYFAHVFRRWRLARVNPGLTLYLELGFKGMFNIYSVHTYLYVL